MKNKLKLCNMLLITIFVAQLIFTTEATQDLGSLENSGVPDNVVKIVEAISKVQKDVTVNPNNVNNIKVATGNWRNKSSTKSPSTEKDQDLFKPLVISPDAKPTIVKKKPSPDTAANEIEKIEDNLIETEEVTYSNVNLAPPQISIFSYRGISEWFEWVVQMRDPKINPDGTSSWRSIITTGIFSLAQQYNPFRSFFRRGFFGRSLDIGLTAKMLAVYNNRDEIIEKLASNEIQPDAQSILDYAMKLENEKSKLEKSDDVTDLSKTNLDKLPTPLSSLIDVLNGQNIQLGLPVLSNVVVDKPEASPTEVKFINGILKWFYVLIPLLFLPFSGIENFFIAPLPPNLDTVPGMLRLFGVQALLGPDYILDYDAAYDPAYDTPGDTVADGPIEDAGAVGPPLPPPGEIDDYTDYDYDTRRRKDNTQIKKKYKPKSSYAPMGESMKPPPSRYGVSSYTSFKNKAAEE